jgi:hypothetical protein
MSPADTIDFTRGSVGSWFFFVIGAVLMVARARPGTELFKKGWGQAARFILVRALIGVLMAAPVVGLLALWQRVGTQYFIKMHLAKDNLVLEFRWPISDQVIPLQEVQKIKVRRLGRGTHRLEVDTSTRSFRSFGYARLEDEEYRALDRMRQAVDPRQPPRDLLEANPQQ